MMLSKPAGVRDGRRRDDAGGRSGQSGAHRAGGAPVAVDITPPFDCTMWNGPCERLRRQRLFELAEIAADHRLQIGVQRRGRRAFELADFQAAPDARPATIVVGPDCFGGVSAARSFSGLA